MSAVAAGNAWAFQSRKCRPAGGRVNAMSCVECRVARQPPHGGSYGVQLPEYGGQV
jgi:hypothetical protein